MEIENRFIEECTKISEGISDTHLQTILPNLNVNQRGALINKLLKKGKIEVLKRGNILVYRLKDAQSTESISGSTEEKVVHQIIKTAGNKGIEKINIRRQSNLPDRILTGILKNLEKMLTIKTVKTVLAGKKVTMYMLYNLNPDQSVMGGSWYSGQDFDTDFVKVLVEQSYRYLKEKFDSAQKKSSDPEFKQILASATVNEVLEFITGLKISKIQLSSSDIEKILEALVYDGKIVQQASIGGSSLGNGNAESRYRCIKPKMDPSGLVQTPCGLCPNIRECSQERAFHPGIISPLTCIHLKNWLDF